MPGRRDLFGDASRQLQGPTFHLGLLTAGPPAAQWTFHDAITPRRPTPSEGPTPSRTSTIGPALDATLCHAPLPGCGWRVAPSAAGQEIQDARESRYCERADEVVAARSTDR